MMSIFGTKKNKKTKKNKTKWINFKSKKLPTQNKRHA
jgi:hypothetical protein